MDAIRQSAALVQWLAEQLAGIRIDGAVRTRAAAVCFGIAQDHHRAIVTLLALRAPIHTSAFALARPLLEAYVRGTWLAHCAKDQQVERYLSESATPDMASLIAGIDKLGEYEEASNLRRLYDAHWKSLSGMTHGGAEHHARWADGEILEPEYSEAEVNLLAAFSASIGVISAAGLAAISEDGSGLWQRILDQSKLIMPMVFPAPSKSVAPTPTGGNGPVRAAKAAHENSGKN